MKKTNIIYLTTLILSLVITGFAQKADTISNQYLKLKSHKRVLKGKEVSPDYIFLISTIKNQDGTADTGLIIDGKFKNYAVTVQPLNVITNGKTKKPKMSDAGESATVKISAPIGSEAKDDVSSSTINTYANSDANAMKIGIKLDNESEERILIVPLKEKLELSSLRLFNCNNSSSFGESSCEFVEFTTTN